MQSVWTWWHVMASEAFHCRLATPHAFALEKLWTRASFFVSLFTLALHAVQWSQESLRSAPRRTLEDLQPLRRRIRLPGKVCLGSHQSRRIEFSEFLSYMDYADNRFSFAITKWTYNQYYYYYCVWLVLLREILKSKDIDMWHGPQ